MGDACRFCLAAFIVYDVGGVLSTMHVIVKRYNGGDTLLAECKSVRSRAFFSSENWFCSHPGFLTLRAADGGYAPAKKLVQADGWSRFGS